jgi:hypothetical protein
MCKGYLPKTSGKEQLELHLADSRPIPLVAPVMMKVRPETEEGRWRRWGRWRVKALCRRVWVMMCTQAKAQSIQPIMGISMSSAETRESSHSTAR